MSVDHHEDSPSAMPPFEIRLRALLAFVRQRRDDMTILFREAKLRGRPVEDKTQREGWNNVAKHCVAEAAAMQVLWRALRMPPDQEENMVRMAFLHNANMRSSLEGNAFGEKTRKDEHETVGPEALEILRGSLGRSLEELDPEGRFRTWEHDLAVNPECNILHATGPAFLYAVFEDSDRTLEEALAIIGKEKLLQYYIDSVFIDGTLVSGLKRIEDTEKRRPELNANAGRTARLGGIPYWDAERLLFTTVQTQLHQWLQDADPEVKLPPPEQLHLFVQSKINEAVMTHDRGPETQASTA